MFASQSRAQRLYSDTRCYGYPGSILHAIMILAVFGNILVISTVWRNTHMQTVTNYYIVNLAISDFFVSSTVMPLKLLEYTAPCEWKIFSSDGLCSVTYYTLPIFVFTSVLTLVAISLERYYAIVHPLSAMKVNSKSRTRKILAATWIIPIIICSPYVYCESFSFTLYSELGEISRQTCNDRFDEIDGETGKFRKGFFIVLFIIMYFLPMVVIVTTCTKIAICLVAKMVIVVAAAFIMSWSPFYIVSIVSQLQTKSFLRESNFIFTMLMTHLSGFINSCVNPFIYTVMSEKFRKSFRRTLNIVFCSYYCRQRLLRYRESLSTRRPTAMTSFVEPEEEPLQNNCHSGRVFRGKLKQYSHSSSDSGSHKSEQSLKKSKRTEKPGFIGESGIGKRVLIADENIELHDLDRNRALDYSHLQSNNEALETENDDYNLALNETSPSGNIIMDNDFYRNSNTDPEIAYTDSTNVSENNVCLSQPNCQYKQNVMNIKYSSNEHTSPTFLNGGMYCFNLKPANCFVDKPMLSKIANENVDKHQMV
ncbi:hypothetical protein KUTeg_013360 [Tegillarca granosa]|uniref:G-protein coupled receptors family 1 profile domain-containing protein n=1 Tax=Tegillarca granosa TaxID=220873 RepID=A0ABQ9EWZ0_TEGGR|nr:hypothetical protein KUTeg_013360 [Tegillarca granosa]